MLSVIIPVYNERRTLGRLLARVSRALPDVGKEILIVDDCSTDGTREWLRANFAEGHVAASGIEIDPSGQVVLTPPGNGPGIVVRVEYHERNLGKGGALQSGLAAATGDVFVIQDADLEYDPEDWSEMYDLIAVRKVADVVYGSRFYGRPHRSLNFHHYLGNRLISLLFNALYNQTLTDIEVCYKMFSREVRDSLHLTCNDFGVEVQISAQISSARRWRIYELGIRYFGRTYEEGKKINWTGWAQGAVVRAAISISAGLRSVRDRLPRCCRSRVFSLGFFVLLLAVFAASPVTTSYDSRWSIHTAMSFAHGQGGDLTEYLPIIEQEHSMPSNIPMVGPVRAIPSAPLCWPCRLSSCHRGSARHLPKTCEPASRFRTEQLIASIIGAAAAVIFFWVIFSQFQSLAIALASTFIFAFARRYGRRRRARSGSTVRWS